jgi:hypothetical protein
VQGRVDANAYISSMLTGTNCELVHLGGVQRRRGLVQKFICPNKLTLLTGTYTLPDGPSSVTGLGTNSQTNKFTTTTPPDTTDPWVLVHIDFGAAKNVLFADVLALTIAGGTSTEFCIQYSNDNSTWATLGSNLGQVDSTANYTYRRTAGITYPATYTSARYWRVAKIGGANLTYEATFADFVLWGDSGIVSAGRQVPFEVSTGEPYLLTMTDHSGIISSAGTIVDYIALPYASADLAGIDAQSSAESMMIVHENYAPQFAVRLSSPLATGVAHQAYYNFQTFLAVFDAIPQVDYADSSSPTPTSDIQTLTFSSSWNPGDTFELTIQSDTTGPITYLGDNQNTANAIAKAVQALWVVNGFSGVSCTSNGSYGYTLTFANDSAGDIGNIAITSLSSSATASTSETQTGTSRQENVWSPTRGYPSTVTFFQGRMYMGGLRSQQESLVGSWVNDILNFSTDQGLDDQAIYTTLNGVALNAVTALFPGKSLCVFTTGGEFRFVNDNGQPIIPTSIPTNQTQYGTAHIKPVMIDGNILLVQRNLNSVRDFQFDYTQDQYNSLGISSFAPNLVYDVQDMAAWNGSVDEEINLVFICNGTNSSTDSDALPNGTCAVYNTRKEASVQAWTVWETAGYFRNVASVVQDVFFLIQRTLNGVTVLSMEQAVGGTFTDCGTGTVTASNITSVSGLGWLNGVSCRVKADGVVLDTVTPSGGVVNFLQDGRTYTVKSNYEIGINFNPTVTPMPLQTVRWPDGSNLARKKRIVKVRIKVRNTAGLLYNGKILPTQTIDTFNFDSTPALYSGILRLEDSSNWDETEDKLMTFTQVDPLPFYIMYIDAQLAGEYG